jgi:Xaa-Pro aminopeptidase
VQKEAMKLMRHGAKEVDKQTRPLFAELGFATDVRKGTGYIHSLGHGIGLELHEGRQFSSVLHTGNVMTVEPGLYYEYGIRVEDIGAVTKNGFSNFTKISKDPYL